MSDEVNEVWRAIREMRQETGKERRQRAERDYVVARRVAVEAGMRLARFSSSHYRLTTPGRHIWFGWDIYPGNGRIRSYGPQKAPRLGLSPGFTLCDAIAAADQRVKEHAAKNGHDQ